MATARSVSTYQSNMPNPGVYVDTDQTGQSIWEKFGTALTGHDYGAEYQNALTENNRRYEQAMLQDARNYETWFDSTAMQRRMADLKAAGVNPWLALQSGGVSANGNASANSYSPGSGSSAKRQSSQRTNGLAFFLMAVAKLIAAA